MNLCCKFIAGVYSPSVRSIPISKDEQFCMREAQLHSGLTPTSAPNPSQTSPSQLDPGSQVGAGNQQKRRVSKAAGGAANSLLKQAIANRLSTELQAGLSSPKPVEPSLFDGGASPNLQENGDKDPARVHKTDSNEMSKSVLLNPAWYRDEQGRTGYKTSDWERISNKQKEIVKENKRRKHSKSGDASYTVNELDNDLLSSESSSVEKKLDAVESPKMDKKEEKKAAKAMEKELKKQEKEQKKREKEERKKMKKKGSVGSIESTGTVIAEKESVEVKAVQKKKEKANVEANIKIVPIGKNDEKQKKKKTEKSNSIVSTEDTSSDVTMVQNVKAISKVRSNQRVEAEETSSSNGSRNSERVRPMIKSSRLALPSKTTIGQRRDSNMSELSKVSFKSVTFNDRVQTHEIERHISVSSSEDDVAMMSDDELARPNEYRRRKLQMLRNQKKAGESCSSADDMYDEDDLEDFEEQERLALMAEQGCEEQNEQQWISGYPKYNLDQEDEEDEEDDEEEDDSSQNSYYAEDVEGADIYLKNEHSFIEMDLNPASQQSYHTRGLHQEFRDPNPLGSMSRLHAGDDSSNSLLFGYSLPRSASGYFEAPHVAMNYSYEEAIARRGQLYGEYHPEVHPDIHIEPQQIPSVHQSPEQVPGQLRTTTTQRSIYENIGPMDQPVSPQIRNQYARHQFFTSTTQTPMNIVSKTTMASSDTLSMASSGSDATIREEDEMRKRFVARFGARKAPIAAREEDPADPVHVMGSQESMNSTDSRESVVSAASNKAEALARRYFNY